MPDTMKVPGFGEMPKKYVIGGVVVGVGVVGVIVIRNKRAASAASASTATQQTAADAGNVTDPAGNVCAALDPNSGYCPGSAEDTAFQDQQYGSGIYGGSGFDSGAYGASGFDAGGFPIGSAQDLQWQLTQSTGLSTNEEWLAQAESNVPGNPGTIAAALTAVLGGLTVTTAQKNLFLEAVGINGQPPQGYPKPIKTSDTSHHPQPTGKVAVPYVVGTDLVDAQRDIAAAGLKSTATGPLFKPGTGAVRSVTGQTPSGGSEVARGSNVKLVYKIEGGPAHKPPVKR